MEKSVQKSANIGQNNEKATKKTSFFKRLIFFILFIVLLPIIILYSIIKFIVKKVKKAKWERAGKRGKLLLLQSDISNIDIMEGYEFEEYLKTLFFYVGYSVTGTAQSKDYGADLILTSDKGEKIIVQAKRYSKKVGVKSVQEAYGAIKHYNATDAIVVTNSHFSNEAEILAKENNIRLIDREELIEIYTYVKNKLKIETKESELVGKEDKSLEDKYPYMI